MTALSVPWHRPGRVLSGWRLPLRVARRDARHAPGRSVLIILMIMLPVLGLTSADIIYRTGQLNTSERLSRELGQTQASLSPETSAPNQTADPAAPSQTSTGTATSPTITASLPAAERILSGARLLRSSSTNVYMSTRYGLSDAPLESVETGDPAFRGRYRLEQGRTPANATEVAATPALYRALSARLGQRLQFRGWARPLTLVGVVAQVGSHADERLFTAPELNPGAPAVAADGTQNQPPTYYVADDRPVTWQQVRELNRVGFYVDSRYVSEHPPPNSVQPQVSQFTSTARLLGLVVGILAVSLALLEVVLLAGAAFAVGARRQSRWLGLLVATGGDSRHVRRVVLGGGLILGIVGSVLGIGLGIATAALAIPRLQPHIGQDFGHFDIRPAELLAVALLGTGTGLLAAVLPARTASRQDPVAALSGRRGEVRTPRKVPAFGFVLVVLGIVCAAIGSAGILARINHAQGLTSHLAWVLGGLIAIGAGLTQFGLIVCSPALVGWAARLSTRAPLPFRLAMRDAGRHRGRSAPAVAAILTAVAGSTAALLIVGSYSARDRENYYPQGPRGSVQVQLTISSRVPVVTPDFTAYPEIHLNAARVLAAVGPALPAGNTSVLRTPACAGANCQPLLLENQPPAGTRCTPDLPASDWRCNLPQSGDIVVGGPENLDGLTGHSSASAVKVLKEGGIVFVDRHFQGQRVGQVSYRPDGPGYPKQPASYLSVPATYLAGDTPTFSAIVSPALVARVHDSVSDTSVLFRPAHMPSRHQEQAATAALATVAPDAVTTLHVERGYQSRYLASELSILIGAGVIMLGAAGIATGLAQADARADQATLLAIGATPQLRRTLAASQALAVAGLGSTLGLLSGLVPALAFIDAVPTLSLAVPWLPVLAILIGLPLLAASASWLLTRSQLAMDRRIAV